MVAVKIVGALLMLGLMFIGTMWFGLVGFAVTLVLSIIVSWSISKREKEAEEKKRHQEVIDAIKANSTK